ncbi:MAG: LysM peptidoglycan-binding domain-containing protein [Flavobacterium sp.]
MKYPLVIILLGFFFCSILTAQESLIKHTVKRGETVIGISQQYKVTPNDLYRLNPGLMEEGLKAETEINVPVSQVSPRPSSTSETSTPSAQPSNTNSTSNEVLYHTVMQGETKFGLSSRYGLTIDELEEQNPQIKNMLMTGQRLSLRGAKDNAPKTIASTSTSVDLSQTTSYVVQPGETLWGLSRRYGVTVDDLLNANKANWTGVLRSGQTLMIPSKGSASQTALTGTSRTDMYVVQPGETKYGLSRRFSLTIDELEELNPHIKRMLQSGHRILTSLQRESPTSQPQVVQPTPQRIEPVKQPEATNQPEVATTTQSSDWGLYEVMPGETLFGLSRKSGATIDEIVERNPELKEGLRSGMKINLPGGNVSVTNTTPKSEPISKPEVVKVLTRPTGLLATINKIETKKIAVVIPFEESELIGSLNTSNVSSEMRQFSGLKIAIDSIKHLGVNLEIEFFNSLSQQSIEKVSDKMDAILMLSSSTLPEKKLTIFQKNNVPVITFNATISNQPNTYLAVPQMQQVREKLIQYIKSVNAEVVVVTNGTKNRPEHLWLNDTPEFKIIEANVNGTINESELRKSLSNQKKTIVLMDTDRQGVYLNVTNVLLKESADKDIQLMSLITREQLLNEGVSEIRFKVLKLLYPSFNGNPKTTFHAGISKAYQNKYGIPITYDAVSGFDGTFDTLLRLFQVRNFTSLAKDEVTEQTAHRFQYEKSEQGGFHNIEIYLYQYSENEVSIPVKF